MPAPSITSSSASWMVVLTRALLALALGAFVTFSADHTPTYGSIVFGSWAILQGALLLVSGLPVGRAPGARLSRLQGLLGLLIGSGALALSSVGLGALLLVVTAFGAVTAALEIYRALRAERGQPLGRESLFVGIVTALLALVFLAIPADGVLIVGLIGAYGIVLGVYLAIAAVSLRLPVTRTESTSAERGVES